MAGTSLDKPLEALLKNLSLSGDDTFGDAFVRLSKSLDKGEKVADPNSRRLMRASVSRLLGITDPVSGRSTTISLSNAACKIMKILSSTDPISPFEKELLEALASSRSQNSFELSALIVGRMVSNFPMGSLALVTVLVDTMVSMIRNGRAISANVFSALCGAYALPDYAKRIRKLSPVLVDALGKYLFDSTQESRFNEVGVALGLFSALPNFHSPNELEKLMDLLAIATSNPHPEVWKETQSVEGPFCLMCRLVLHQPASCGLRKPSHLSTVVTCFLHILRQQHATMEDESTWERALGLTESASISSFGQFCRVVDQEQVFSALLSIVSAHLSMEGESYWPQRACALQALLESLDCLGMQVSANLDRVLSLLLPSLTDTQSRVRVYAISSLKRILGGVQTVMDGDFHETAISLLLPLFDDPSTRVRTAVLAYFTVFLNRVKENIANTYAPTICSLLLPKVIEAVSVTTLSTLSPTQVNLLKQYLGFTSTLAFKYAGVLTEMYEPLMMALKSLLVVTDPTVAQYSLENVEELRIRACCFDTIGVVFGAGFGPLESGVGSAAATAHVSFVMDHLLQKLPTPALMDTILQYEGTSYSFKLQILKTCVRIASTLKDEFAPHLPHLMLLLLKIANTPQSKFVSISMDVKKAEILRRKTPRSRLVPLPGNQASVVNLNVLGDKINASKLLAILVQNLGRLMTKYLPDIHNTFKELLIGGFDRDAAVSGFSTLILAAEEICRESGGDTKMVLDIYSSFLFTVSAAILRDGTFGKDLEVSVLAVSACSALLSKDLMPEHIIMLAKVRTHVLKVLSKAEVRFSSKPNTTPDKASARMHVKQSIAVIRYSLDSLQHILTLE